MFDLIEKLRQKPENVKKRIAFLGAFFFSGVIFVIWLTIVLPNFTREQSNIEKISKSEPSPIGTFTETFKTGMSAIVEEVSKFRVAVQSMATTTYYVASSSRESGVGSTTEKRNPNDQ